MKNKCSILFGFTVLLIAGIIMMTGCNYEAPKFPSSFNGIWEHQATYADTLTFTSDTVKASNQSHYWKLIDVSGDSYTMEESSNRYHRKMVVIKLNEDLEIDGDSGTGRDNWNGSWRRK